MSVLILTQPSHPATTYGRYTAEVLKAGSFAGPRIRRPGPVTAAMQEAQALVPVPMDGGTVHEHAVAVET